MYINFASDWPAYIFMAAFLWFMTYVIMKGRSQEDVSVKAIPETKKVK
ncbi:MAG: hypothetical protein FWF00_06775 [Endomicrobia bacterium]|nr:hypothetical protein [Endomicrobiia bacterium]MCL2507368.1 hypothetical protein [Endomicrobiia bacterium]